MIKICFSPTSASAIIVLSLIGIISLNSPKAMAQGCIIGRQCTPGASSSHEFLMPGELEYGLTYRTFRASDMYVGTTFQTQRRDLNNYVINRQNIFDFIVTKGLTNRTNLTIDVPFLNNGYSIPIPVGSAVQSPGPRAQEKGKGIGDISLLWKNWLKDRETQEMHKRGNIVLGIGLKLPTGKSNVTNILPDAGGNNPQPRTVDQSIQPGDGSLGVPTSVEAYQPLGRANLFFTGNYLISPRDTNGVASGFAPTKPSPSINVFSVPDQYLFRVGVGTAIPKLAGLSNINVALSWRKEGVPAKDLIGGSHGFRRPGFSTSIEPSLGYTKGKTSVTISTPITLTRNRLPTVSDGIAVSGDATFARRQLILNISHRMGR